MKNLWPESFEASEATPPKKILDEQSGLLPQLTGDMVSATVTEMDPIDAMMYTHENDFSYQFFLLGKFLKNYKFKIFDFSHSISIYPINVSIDEEIAKELGLDVNIHPESEEEFVVLIRRVFGSNRLKKVIGSIIQLSGSK